MKTIISIVLFLNSGVLFSQNLIPNHNFEENKQSINESVIIESKEEFNNSIEYWNSPISTTPDIIKKGKDSTFVGILLYGKGNCQNEWREYIQVKLLKDLQINTQYSISLRLGLKKGHSPCNNLGFLFRETPLYQQTCDRIQEVPQISFDQITTIPEHQTWITKERNFVADKAYKYLIIGNFSSDKATQIRQKQKIGIGQFGNPILEYLIGKVSYYYIDDVVLEAK